ncbi:hypothetical protein [Nocardia abscessus]|uniref:hypothetical protein n=1 Tax=Nocardia abscessus TaxID=120957 RepID=UPI00245515C8|nr:hypothetical protein [Nocardia abscessus]
MDSQLEDMATKICRTLVPLLQADAPSQFVSSALGARIKAISAQLQLPEPKELAGNIVVGELETARFVLSAHLDEASFTVLDISGDITWLAPLHRMDAQQLPAVRLVGIRDGVLWAGPGSVLSEANGRLVGRFGTDVRLGDRAVYDTDASADGKWLSGKAIDDRAGAVVALFAAAEMTKRGIPTAVVLSDGEQNVPDGYFSRTFPHILGRLRDDCLIIFIDGIFGDGLRRAGLAGPQPAALVVPHTADGRGYSVPPRLFARLRDDVVPKAQARGIDVQVTGAYHSRGDDWGMVCNPVSGVDRQAFFVSFGGDGLTAQSRTIDSFGLVHCCFFVVEAATELSKSGR